MSLPLLPSAIVRAKARQPSRPLKGADQAGARQTPEKKRGARGAKSRALPAHLWDVARDLGRFFLELFPFCGRYGFVARGD